MNRQLLILLLVLASASTMVWGAKKHVKGILPLPSPSPNPLPGNGSTPATPYYRPENKDPRSSGANREGTGKDNLGDPGALGVGKCDQKHSIETFVQMAYATGPQAAPDGGVYFLSDLRDVPQVFYLKSAGNWPEQVSFFPDGVVYFQLSPDGEKMLLATHVGGDEQYDIYLLEPKNRKLTPLLVDRQKRVESVAWSTTSQWFAFTSNTRNKTDMDLYRYDLKKNQPQLLQELSGHNRVTDVSPNDRLVAVTNFRSVADGDVTVFQLANGQLANLTKHSDEISYDEGHFTGDSRSIFVLSDVDKGVHQLFLLPLDTRLPKKLITAEKWEIEEYALDDSRTQLAYSVNEDGYGRIEGFTMDAAGRRARNLPVPKMPLSVLRSPSFAFGKKKGGFFFTHSSSVNNSDVWFWQYPKKTQWTQSTHGLIHPECFVREELIHYPSFDKRMIPGFLYYPRSAQGPVPFIIYAHGGPTSQYRPIFSKLFQYFLERGFGVLAPNFRGSTGYGRDYSEMDNYKKRMDSVKDTLEGAHWLISQRYTKPGSLAIFGGSYGGFMVLRSLEVEPDLFAAASESVGITNFVTFLKNTKSYRRALREIEYGPLSDEEFLKSISPMTYIDQIKTPLLIFHGANDPRVPVGESEQIVEQLRKREIPVDYKVFSDEGHGNHKLQNIMEQARQTAYFFEKYLKKIDTP